MKNGLLLPSDDDASDHEAGDGKEERDDRGADDNWKKKGIEKKDGNERKVKCEKLFQTIKNMFIMFVKRYG